MPRSILIFLVLIALAVGVYFERVPLRAYWRQTIVKVHPGPDATGGAPDATDPQASAANYTGGSREPGSAQKAAPGTFFMLKRAKVVSSSGVKAVNPGEQVRLLERLPNGRLRVTVGNADFEVTKAQVTDDLDAAREAERRFHTSPDQSL